MRPTDPRVNAAPPLGAGGARREADASRAHARPRDRSVRDDGRPDAHELAEAERKLWFAKQLAAARNSLELWARFGDADWASSAVRRIGSVVEQDPGPGKDEILAGLQALHEGLLDASKDPLEADTPTALARRSDARRAAYAFLDATFELPPDMRLEPPTSKASTEVEADLAVPLHDGPARESPLEAWLQVAAAGPANDGPQTGTPAEPAAPTPDVQPEELEDQPVPTAGLEREPAAHEAVDAVPEPTPEPPSMAEVEAAPAASPAEAIFAPPLRLGQALSEIGLSILPGAILYAAAFVGAHLFLNENAPLVVIIGFAISVMVLRSRRGRAGQASGTIRLYIRMGFVVLTLADIGWALVHPDNGEGVYVGSAVAAALLAVGVLAALGGRGAGIRFALFSGFAALAGLYAGLSYAL